MVRMDEIRPISLSDILPTNLTSIFVIRLQIKKHLLVQLTVLGTLGANKYSCGFICIITLFIGIFSLPQQRFLQYIVYFMVQMLNEKEVSSVSLSRFLKAENSLEIMKNDQKSIFINLIKIVEEMPLWCHPQISKRNGPIIPNHHIYND